MSDGNGGSLATTAPESQAELRALEAEFRALESNILLARATFMRQAGITFGGARDEYEIFGYDRLITNKQYRDEYARGGIAGRVVDVMPDACWRGDPAMELVEDEDPETDTEFEKKWKEIDAEFQICAKMQRVDRLARLSTYAVLLIGDGGNLDEEISGSKLLYLMPFSGGGGPGANADARMLSVDASCTIAEYDIDTRSSRFGLPSKYQLKRTDFASPDFQRPVHHSRIIHVAEGLLEDDVFGQPALERVWNLLADLRKVTGGGAEAFWLRANQGMHIDVDKDLTLDKGQYADVITKLKEQSELYKHQLTRWIQTRGTKVEPLGSDVANFANPADAVITQIAGSKAIPKRILTGSEMGELASSQDRENFKDQINGRQTQYCGPIIVRQLVNRFIKYGFLPTPRKGVLAYQVKWPHIQTLTEEEKAKGALSWSTTTVDGKPVFTDAEIRDKWYGYEPLTTAQLKAYYDRKVQDARTQAATQKLTQPPAAQQPLMKAAETGDEELIRVLADAITAGATDVVARIVGLPLRAAGGEGSGNYGHAGRPGEVGGSTHGGGFDPAREYVQQYVSTHGMNENPPSSKQKQKLRQAFTAIAAALRDPEIGVAVYEALHGISPHEIERRLEYLNLNYVSGGTGKPKVIAASASPQEAFAEILALLKDPDTHDFVTALLADAVAAGTWERFETTLKTAESYSYGSTQVQLPSHIAARLFAFGRTIRDEDLAPHGRETDAHITVKYGLLEPDPKKIFEVVARRGAQAITLGGTKIFAGDDYDVVVVSVRSPDLAALHTAITLGMACKDSDYSTYVPHATVAYVQPGRGAAYAGWRGLDGVEFLADSIMVTDVDGNKTEISLLEKGLRAAFDPDQPRDDAGKWTGGGMALETRAAKIRDEAVTTEERLYATRLAQAELDLEAKVATGDSKDANTVGGVYTSERLAIHDGIIQQYFIDRAKQGDNIPRDLEHPHMIMMAGAPGAGKTTARGELDLKSYVVADSDQMKEYLRPYGYDGVNAIAYQRETSDLSAKLTEFARQNHMNVLIDRANRSAGSLTDPAGAFDGALGQLAAFRDEGYSTEYRFVSVPLEVSISRAVNRYIETGRYVPMSFIRDTMFDKNKVSIPEQSFRRAVDTKIAGKPLVDHAWIFDGVTHVKTQLR